LEQYLLYLNSLLHGDLGASFRYADWSVNDLGVACVAVSLTIGGVSMVLAIVLGVVARIVAALYSHSHADYLLMIIGIAGSAFPSFVIGTGSYLVFAILLSGCRPVAGTAFIVRSPWCAGAAADHHQTWRRWDA